MNEDHERFLKELEKRGIEPLEGSDGETTILDVSGTQCLVSDMHELDGGLMVGFADLTTDEAFERIFGARPIDRDSDVSVLEMDARVTNALHKGGIHTVGDLADVGDLTSVKGIGQLTAKEIEHVLEGVY